jgi:hypothetical protein
MKSFWHGSCSPTVEQWNPMRFPIENLRAPSTVCRRGRILMERRRRQNHTGAAYPVAK